MAATPQFCSTFHRAIELIGGRWTGAVLRALLDGEQGYADIRNSIPGLSDTMLAQRLRELETEGLVQRNVLPTSPVRVEYRLTEKGQAVEPVLDALGIWAEEWVEAPESPTASPAGAST